MTKVGVIPTDLRMDIDYVFFYNNLTKLVITGVVPFVALCVFNFKIYAALRRRRQVRATFRLLIPEAAVNEICEDARASFHSASIWNSLSTKELKLSP